MAGAAHAGARCAAAWKRVTSLDPGINTHESHCSTSPDRGKTANLLCGLKRQIFFDVTHSADTHFTLSR
jgi:hypothetical protein